jgi:flagellar hook-length control protein FliK
VLPPVPPAGMAIDATTAVSASAEHKITPRPDATGTDPARPGVSSDAPLGAFTPTVAPAAAPTTASVGAPSPPHAASPAEQVAPALLTLAKTADGSQQMTVRLQPADLGMVQVRIARAMSGATQIEITAENPATLLALQRDQPQLHRTLDEAGISAAGRTVTFHAAPSTQAAATQAAAGSNGSGSSAGHGSSQQGPPAGRTGAGTTDPNGSSGGGRGSYAARERNTYPTGTRTSAPPAAAGTPAAKSYRVGLDITA